MILNELLQIVLPRYGSEVPQGKFIEAANAVQETIAARLWLANSDLLRTTLAATMAIGASSYALTSGTLALAERPWITNSDISPGRELIQLPTALRNTFIDNGHPQYFEQRGLTILTYPDALVETTVKTEVFSRPTTFALLSNTIPWDGLFDQVFIEATPRFNIAGGFITVSKEMQAFIDQRVDQLIYHRPAKSITWMHPA